MWAAAIEAMAIVSPGELSDEETWAHWLIWGCLTDWIEVRPAEVEEASAAIVDAARSWLATEGDPVAVSTFYDRVIYDVCGYPKPWQPTAESVTDLRVRSGPSDDIRQR